MWDGDAQHFMDVLQESGFLTKDMHINDWSEYTGRLVSQRENNRERQRRYRDKNKPENTSSKPSERDVTVTSPSGNGATVPNTTEHNTTEPTGPEGKDGTPSAPPVQISPKTPKRKSETPFPDDLELDKDLLKYAEEQEVTEDEARNEFEKFRNQAQATDRRQRDWRASWRTWITSAISYGHVGPVARKRINVTSFQPRGSPYKKDIGLTNDELEAIGRGEM